MKPLILICVLFFSLSSFGQQPEYPDSGFTNKAEAKNLMVNGKKEGKWVEYVDTTNPGVYVSTAYHLFVYKDGKPFGIEHTYDRKGNLESVIPYVNGLKNGVEKVYIGIGLTEYPFVNDTINGVVKRYNQHGQIVRESPHVKGKLDGITKDYYNDGKLWCETPFTNDKYNGLRKIIMKMVVWRMKKHILTGKRMESKKDILRMVKLVLNILTLMVNGMECQKHIIAMEY
jgi:antitoxin component YwqK of YwqJK toxin-antitoxin module